MNFSHLSRVVCAALAVGLLAGSSATIQAAIISVSTNSNGALVNHEWTVNDPDFGPYTVTVSGFDFQTEHTDPADDWYYRNNSSVGEDDNTIFWSVSGLNPNAVITGFKLDQTRVTPSVGGGRGSYELTLSEQSTNGVADTRSSTDIITKPAGTGFVPVTPDMEISAASFGNEPVFSLLINEREEQQAFTTRTIGTYNFTITAAAAAVPEPSTVLLLGMLAALMGSVHWWRRRKGI